MSRILCYPGFIIAASILAVSPSAASPLSPPHQGLIDGAGQSLVRLAQFTPPRLRNRLRQKGYRRIKVIRRTENAFVVRACLDGERFRLRARRGGRILSSVRIGRCDGDGGNVGGDYRADGDYRDRDNYRDRDRDREALRPPQVRRVLQRRGFNRIRFIDRELPVYVVRACRHGRRFKMRLNRFARVRNRELIGRCDDDGARERGYSRSEIRDILQRRGYRDISFLERAGPGFRVSACRRAQKFRMRVNRFAEVRQRRRTGWCKPVVRPEPDRDVDDYYNDSDIDATGEIDPETCQDYLDAVARRNRIHFDVDSARLRSASFPLLRRLARVMKRCPSSEIEITGHTDSDGSREYNQDLSERRVISVARPLKREGISTRRMSARGYGEDRPLAPYERTERDKALNRRIEFTVLWGDDKR